MPPLPTPAYRLDLWTAPAPAGGTRAAFLVDAGGRAATNVQRARFLEPGRSALTFDVLSDFHAVALLAPQQGVVRFTEFVATGPDTHEARVEEWRIASRRRTIRRGVGVYEISCVPIEEDLLDAQLWREVSDGGFSRWRYAVVDATPAAVLADVRDDLIAAGYTWVDVGTVTPTAPVTFELVGTATPRAILQALVEQLVARGIPAEFQFTLASDLSEYRLELVARVAGALPALVATTDASALDVRYDEDALEQANVIIPFGDEGVDLADLIVEIAAVDGGTGWVTLQALGGSAALVVAVDDQFNGKRLFRERTGRSFAILDTTASPMRVQLATTDLASGLAAGERVSFRESELLTGERRAFLTATKYAPAEVVSTATSPARITTRNLDGGTDFLAAANQYRDWALERSQLVATLPTGDFDHAAGTFALASTPAANPAPGDWLWFPLGGKRVPLEVTAYDSMTEIVSGTPRYAGHQFTESKAGITGVKCYRPVGTPMWIQASTVTGNEFQVDAHTGPSFASTDVLEIIQRGLGPRLVELADPAAIAATRRKVATVQVAATGATNRVPNADQAAWAGASGDPPNGWTIGAIVGTVTRSRETDPLFTRYGGWSWKLAFAASASAEIFTPAIDVHPVPGAAQVAAGLALLFTQFTGKVPVTLTLYAVTDGGARTALGDAVRCYPPDTTVQSDAANKVQLDAWYDAVLTNQSLETLGASRLQLGLARPAGASNPACTFYVDAAILLPREGLVSATDGGVRHFADSDALPLLTAGHAALLDRARPLVRFEGQFLDLFRLDGLRHPAAEFVVGRDVALTIPALAVARTVRLLGVVHAPDDPRTARAVLDRVRPDLGRLLAPTLVTAAPITEPVPQLPPVSAYLELAVSFDDDNYSIVWDGGPIVEYSVDGRYTWTPLTASPLVLERNNYYNYFANVRARSAIPNDVKDITVGVEHKPFIVAGEAKITGVSTSAHSTPCDGGGGFDLDITATDMPGDVEYDATAQLLSGYAVGPTSETELAVATASLPATFNALDLCSGALVRITVVAKSSGITVAEYETTVEIT